MTPFEEESLCDEWHMLIENKVIVEVKCVERLKDGIKRIILRRSQSGR